MSIEQFGESLLGDIRERKRKEARQQRRKEERQALLGFGLNIATKIGNEALANKTNEFLSKESIWNANQVQKQARYNSSQILKLRDTINAAGGDVQGWAATQMRPDFEARAEEILADEYTGEAGPYRELMRKKVDELAAEWAEEFNRRCCPRISLPSTSKQYRPSG